MGRPLGSKNKSPKELELEGKVVAAKARLKMIEAKLKAEADARQAKSKAAAKKILREAA